MDTGHWFSCCLIIIVITSRHHLSSGSRVSHYYSVLFPQKNASSAISFLLKICGPRQPRASYRPLHTSRAQNTEYQTSRQTPSIVPVLFLSKVRYLVSQSFSLRQQEEKSRDRLFACWLILVSIFWWGPNSADIIHLTWQALWASAGTGNGSLIWE